jgi:hypothetical protein
MFRVVNLFVPQESVFRSFIFCGRKLVRATSMFPESQKHGMFRDNGKKAQPPSPRTLIIAGVLGYEREWDGKVQE